MTKELFLEYCKSHGMEHIAEKFFNDNVVIPRGKNSHPQADIFHAFAEGIPTQYSKDGINWYDSDTSASLLRRIKPKEPVYEWQWVSDINNFEMRTAHITDEEFEKSTLQYDYWSKDLSTKRERK